MAAQLVATIVGLAIVYFKIARQVGKYEERQDQTTEKLSKQETKLDKVIDKLGELGNRVYELFGQLKPKG